MKTWQKGALIGLGALTVFSIIQRNRKAAPVYYVNWLPFNFNGLSLPPFGIFIRKEQQHNEALKLHELVHWKQYKRYGLFLFLLKFVYHQAKDGYDKNPLEIEARFNESDFCKANYTHCVRNGLAKTVSNPDFRK